MKRTILTLMAALMLCSMAATAQITYIKSANASDSSSGSITVNWNAPSGTTAIVACLEGDTVAGGHDDISEVSWNHTGTNFTLVKKWTGPDGSHNNNRMLYLYKLMNPSPADGSVHNLVFKSTNSHYLLAAVANYGGVGDIGASGAYSQATGPLSGTFNPTIWGNQMQTSFDGSWIVLCDGNAGVTQVDNGHAYLRTYGGAGFNFPALFDTGGPIAPARLSTNEYGMYVSFNPTSSDGVEVLAEMLPIGATPISNLFGTFSATNSWVLTGANSGLSSCDYVASAWDTTTSPYTNITSSITSNTCNGTTYDVTVGFAGNQTGLLNLTPNPNKCGSGTC